MEALFERMFTPRPGRVLIVGSKVYENRVDRRALHGACLGIDMLEGEGVDYIHNIEEPLPEELGLFDHVECMSTLEHTPRPWLAAKNIEAALVPGGTLYVTAPFTWRVHGYPDDYYRYTLSGLRALFSGIKFELLAYGSSTPEGESLHDGPKLPILRAGRVPYLARTMALGFGRKAGAVG